MICKYQRFGPSVVTYSHCLYLQKSCVCCRCGRVQVGDINHWISLCAYRAQLHRLKFMLGENHNNLTVTTGSYGYCRNMPYITAYKNKPTFWTVTVLMSTFPSTAVQKVESIDSLINRTEYWIVNNCVMQQTLLHSSVQREERRGTSNSPTCHNTNKTPSQTLYRLCTV